MLDAINCEEIRLNLQHNCISFLSPSLLVMKGPVEYVLSCLLEKSVEPLGIFTVFVEKATVTVAVAVEAASTLPATLDEIHESKTNQTT